MYNVHVHVSTRISKQRVMISEDHSEINVLDALMTTRVTSHIGLKDVAANIDQPAVMRAVDLAYSTHHHGSKLDQTRMLHL